MASRYDVEVTVGSARDLKNVNWRNGDLKPYAVLWIDDGPKCSTRVDLDNGDNPTWDEKVVVPLPPSSRLNDAVLYIDVVHANAADGVKPLVGSARLILRDVVEDAGVGRKASRTLRLKRPSGRPHGRLDVQLAVKEAPAYHNPSRYPAPAAYAYGGGGATDRDHAPSYYGEPGAGAYGTAPGAAPYYASGATAGYAAGAGSYGSGTTAAYGSGQPYAAAPPAGYPAYGAAPPAYGAAAAAPPAAYGVGSGGGQQDPSSTKKKMGAGTGIAVGAAAGLLGGLALAGGASYLENKFEDHVSERVEENLERERDEEYDYGGGGGFDDYGGGYDDDY